VTILISHILYIIYIAPIISPSNPTLPIEAIARGFLVLFHIGIWSLSTIYHQLNLLPSSTTLPLTPTPTHTSHTDCAYFTLLVFIINNETMFKRMYIRMHTVSVLYFGLFNPFEQALTPYPPSSFFSSFQYASLFLYIHILCFTILLMFYYFLFLFLSIFPQIPLLQKYSVTEFEYDHVCFVYILIFGPIFCVWEKTCVFCVSDPG
jgi:hypothetical protein